MECIYEGDEVLAARVGIANALPGRDRLHAHGIGVAVADGIALANQVIVGGGVDLHAVSTVAGDGLSIGKKADEVALNRDVRGAERDTRIAGVHQRKVPEYRSIGASCKSETAGTLRIQGHDG